MRDRVLTRRRERRSGLFWPVALVVVGIVALLGNMGLNIDLDFLNVIDWNMIWPLLLIVVGVLLIWDRMGANGNE